MKDGVTRTTPGSVGKCVVCPQRSSKFDNAKHRRQKNRDGDRNTQPALCHVHSIETF